MWWLPLLIITAVVGCMLGVFALGAIRLRTLSRRPGAFLCGMRDGRSGVWRQGVARYGSVHIEWWRCWSVSVRPARTFARSDLRLISRAPLDDVSGRDLYLVSMQSAGEPLDLAMSSTAYSGLASWLEATPPGIFPTTV